MGMDVLLNFHSMHPTEYMDFVSLNRLIAAIQVLLPFFSEHSSGKTIVCLKNVYTFQFI